MLRRLTERIAFTIGGVLIGVIGYYKYEESQHKLLPKVPKVPITQEIDRFPWPDWRNTAKGDLFDRNAYVASYNRQLRHPNWVLEHLTEESLKRGDDVDRSKSRFKEDEDIPEKFRAKLLDYVKSGYDRGHMAPAADAKLTQIALDETFLLSNIAPQVGNGFNRDYWAHFEEFCRRLIHNEGFKDVYVFTGPAYLPKKDEDGKYYVKYQIIGNPPNIAVPTHFYKVILAAKNNSSEPDGYFYALGTFLMPNERINNSTPLQEFEIALDSLERTTGLTFLSQPIKDKSVPLCKASKCILVANPKYVGEELRSALPEPSKNTNKASNEN